MKYNLNGSEDIFYDLIEELDLILNSPVNDENLHHFRLTCVNIIRTLDHSIQHDVTSSDIKKIIDNYFNIDSAKLTRKETIREARQIGMTLSTELTKESLSKIGESFGGRTHATVLHAKKTIKGLMETKGEKELRMRYQELKNICQNG